MEKKFSKIEIAVIKRTAQNVQQFVNKKEKIKAEIEKVKVSKQEMIEKYAATVDEKIAKKVAKLEADIAAIQPAIDSFQGPVKYMTGGYTTEDLVTRETVHTGKFDSATGKEIIQTRFVLKYPETVVPCGAACPECSSNYDEVVEDDVPPMTEVGNDFDLDAENSEEPADEYVDDNFWK